MRVATDINTLDAAAWDACVGDDDPFVSHALLAAMEDSGSAIAERGWLPQHLAVEDDDGALLAVAPLYLKAHSYGEYVFDWSWADASQRAGLSYYPKLQCCVPFSPVPGCRMMPRPATDAHALQRVLLAAMMELAHSRNLSSLHITFQSKQEWALCGELGMLQRMGIQYHWHNHNYQNFNHFLAALIARKRKAINKERRHARQQGLRVRVLRGDDIKAHHWDAFYAFYLSTIDKKWASAYLTRVFFELLGERLRQRVVLMMAFDDDNAVAGALHLLGKRALYGRYWGATTDQRYIHFELCYYRAIELAIECGLARVEAGAQGPHKLKRGYVPVPTYSSHWLAHPGLRDAVAAFLVRERGLIEEEIEARAATGPYRQQRRLAREGSG